MNKLALLGGALVLANLTPPAYKTYYTARFGYRIDYPADFRPQPAAENGDGRRLLSPDGQPVLSTYTGYKALDGGLAENRKIMREAWQQKHAVFTPDQPTRTSYVLSGQVRGRIFYEKKGLQRNTPTTFLWEHPATRKAALDAMIQHTIQTLQPSVAGSD